MKKPIKRVAFTESFAALGVNESLEIGVRDSSENAVRKSAHMYASKNGVTLSVTFDRQRLVSIVTRQS